MIYTVPDYYKKFRCLASECPATCCAGWKIVIDDRTLKRYAEETGGFGNRLANSIDWEEHTFEQYHGRCAFLNEQNLCDIHLEAGADAMCRTCRMYPRHQEVYENVREISLSLSCPAAAELILGQKEPAVFRSVEKGEDEADFSFDDFLFSALLDTREVLFDIVRSRTDSLELRMAKILALSHDVQKRINGRNVFEVQEVLERYQRPQAGELLAQKLRKFAEQYSDADSSAAELDELLSLRWRILDYLRDFEVLDPAWTDSLQEWRSTLYAGGVAAYLENYWEWQRQAKEWETEYEQILMYLLFTYFCGAVYDGDALKKVQAAVISILMLKELGMAEWLKNKKMLSFQDRKKIAWRYSRELEHSDPNLAAMERMAGEWKEADCRTLIRLLLKL